MKYSELVQFKPIVTVIELKSADNTDKARKLVQDYVMSNDMAEMVNVKILSQLSLENVVDNKGVLLVGNYGTGKSHLMSVISSIAQNEKLLPEARNAKFREEIGALAGRFEVLRIEIGSTTKSLRAIITEEIEKDLTKRGISFQFPDVSKITNNKDALNDMMEAFSSKYEDKGYLIVVDELLDYLKSRKDNELMQDINFMREIGEFIKNSRFRFMSGIQEALFNNPTFHNVSNTLLKMKDRYEQALIQSQDIAYVAKECVLHKTSEQKAMVREHLMPFCKFYSGMAERIDEYVDLFPIHPAYIDTFQQMVIVEKREVLKTISQTIAGMIDQDVPQKEPGIVSYDSYWKRIKEDPAKRVDPSVAEVLRKSSVLEDIIQRSFTRPAYKPMAMKIIAALSVHRLTTVTLDAELGLTAQNLKDDLCIYTEMPVKEAEFLQSTVETVLREIIKTVSGQFIEYNKENEQYYLDLKKDVDYDQKIEDRAGSLSDDRLDQYFYQLMWDCLDWHPQEYTTGHKIYQYNINWLDKNYFRRGYLFMGTSAERPTAQPPEDFYAYFLPPFSKSVVETEQKEDEVYFRLQPDEAFIKMLHTYAGACECEVTSPQGETKNAYAQRAKAEARKILHWMEEHKTMAFKVSYCAQEKIMLEYLKGSRMDTLTIKQAIDQCVSKALSGYFHNRYPEFPKFKMPITMDNRATVRSAAIKAMMGKKDRLGTETLEALGLWREDKISVDSSPYAVFYRKKLKVLPDGNVLNYDDVMQESENHESLDKRYKLPADIMSIILSALVYSGDCVLVSAANMKYDATNAGDLADRVNPSDIYEFKRLEKPKAAPIMKLRKLFNVLGLNDALIANEENWDNALGELMRASSTVAKTAFHEDTFLNRNPELWGDSILPSTQIDILKKQIQPAKKLDDDIRSRFSSLAKLKNFDYTDEQLVDVSKAIALEEILKRTEQLYVHIQPVMSYMASASVRVSDETLCQKFAAGKEEWMRIRGTLLGDTFDEDDIDDLLDTLEGLKKEYIDYYLGQHSQCRIGISDNKKRQQILDSDMVHRLGILSQLNDIVTTGKYNDLLNNQLKNLRVCYECTVEDMQKNPECPHCGFNPMSHDAMVNGKVTAIEEQLQQMLDDWKESILQSVNEPILVAKKKQMGTELQKCLDQFIQTKEWPTDLQQLCKAIKELFADYECVALSEIAFMEKILSWGTLSPDAFKKKINDYIDSLMGGKDKNQIRLAFTEEREKK